MPRLPTISPDQAISKAKTLTTLNHTAKGCLP